MAGSSEPAFYLGAKKGAIAQSPIYFLVILRQPLPILNPIIEPYTDRWIGKSGYPRYDDFMLSLLSSVENNSGIAEYLCSETLQLRASAIGFAINSNMFSL